MQVQIPFTPLRLSVPVLRPVVLLLAAVGLLAACNGSGGGDPGMTHPPGTELAKPDGSGWFFVDEHEQGRASRLRVVRMMWGRLVDVHDIDALGETNITPLFQDMVINENVQSDGVNFELSTNPITQKTRLIIQRTKGGLNTGNGTFDSLLRQAIADLPPINPKNDDGSDPGPFSFVTRNSAIVVHFDDLLDDSLQAEMGLPETLRVLTGYAPTVPFSPRLRFDPNFGGITDGAYHSTRILIDATVSEAEEASMPVPAPINSIGFPASVSGINAPNLSVRIPTMIDYGSGQFKLLEGLRGGTVANTANGPVDLGSPTRDVVRGMRSGTTTDLNNGFLLDLNSPEILGGWPMNVDSVANDPDGDPGFDFIAQLTYSTICKRRPNVGSILTVNNRYLEATEPASAPDTNGTVRNMRVRLLADDPEPNTNVLQGIGIFLSTYDPVVPVDLGCWTSFTPQPGDYPVSDISPNAQVLIRFSEPMDPLSVTAFGSFMVVRGDAGSDPNARSIVVGDVLSSPDLRDFTFTPLLPFANSGSQDPYHINLDTTSTGVTDLAGNSLAKFLPKVEFDIDETAALEANGGFVMRFDSVDELDPVGPPGDPIYDIRGQFFYDLAAGEIKPRPVLYAPASADRSNPVVAIMIPFPPGVQTPLSPLGSKLQTVWRYVDMGWAVRDESRYNLDVVGLNWSPIAGQVVSDYYEDFEIRLSHSQRLPDESIDAYLLPRYVPSGLFNPPALFSDNILVDPLDPQIVAHNQSLGYVVNPIDLFVNTVGTFLMPFPMNRSGAQRVLWTWRNTAVLAKGGAASAGIPMDIEVALPLYLDPGPVGSIAGPGDVPSYGLPILMEYRCYPSDSGIGLNAFDISLAINSSARPNFRAFSTGGFNQQNQAVYKNPDLEAVPTGGFNPTSSPPGAPTARPCDNSFYLGQLDTVTRISRVHSIWIDTLLESPDFQTPVLEPSGSDQPVGSSIVVEYRGAESIGGYANGEPFDAQELDPYGETIVPGNIAYVNGNATWIANINDVDGGRYLQLRFSFFSNIDSGLGAVCSAYGVAYVNE